MRGQGGRSHREWSSDKVNLYNSVVTVLVCIIACIMCDICSFTAMSHQHQHQHQQQHQQSSGPTPQGRPEQAGRVPPPPQATNPFASLLQSIVRQPVPAGAAPRAPGAGPFRVQFQNVVSWTFLTHKFLI